MSRNSAPDHCLILDYTAALVGKADRTIELYQHILHDLFDWLATRPASDGTVAPTQLTRTAVVTYLASLDHAGYSRSHCARVKAVISGFASWLIETHQALPANPTRGIALPPAPLHAPRQLTPDQRYVLCTLVERVADARGTAMFALGYWAGCRVSDVAWLQMADLEISARAGWIRVGHKGGKTRAIDLSRPAHRALWGYLQQARDPQRPYVFVSQRSGRLTDAGIHHWFRTLKAQATQSAWALIHDITFHDLRHDFAHRVRAAGWTLEEIAYYLGHITRHGTPAIQTTARYTQVGRESMQAKVAALSESD